METDRGIRIGGKWIVLPLVVVTLAVAVVFLTIQFSGRGSAKRNYYALHYTAGLRDLEDRAYTDAIRNLTPVVELGDNRRAVGFRGEAYLQLKDYERAATDFRAAVKQEPELPANHAGLAIALASLGRFREALPQIDEAITRHRGTPPEVPHQVPRSGDSLEEALEWKRNIESRLPPATNLDDDQDAPSGLKSSARQVSRRIDIS